MTFSRDLEQRITKLIDSYPAGRRRTALIPRLRYCQDEVGCVTEELMQECANRLGLTRPQADEGIGYYSMLHKKPLGKHHVQVCTNISCLLVRGEELMAHAKRKLGIGHKEVTADGVFSLEEVECMGACSWAPAIQIGYDFYHNITPDMFDKLIDDIARVNQKVQ